MNRVKEEPPEEFVLVIQAGNDDSPAQSEDEEEEDIDPNCTQFNIMEEPGIDVSTQSPVNQSSKLLQKQLKRRVRKAAPEGIFDCDECDRTFSTSKKLGYHRNKVHDEVRVKCEVCGKMCKNKIALQGHRQSHIKVECSTCHKMITKRDMTRHLQLHSAVKSFECDLCEYSATMKKYLRMHIEKMHLLRKLVNDSMRDDFSNFELLEELQSKYRKPPAPTELKFKCEQCKNSYATNGKLKTHKRAVHTERLFECTFCSKVYKTKYELTRHTLKVHKRSNTEAAAAHSNFHLCSHCQLVFEFQSDLIRHLMTCSKAKSPSFECELCGKMFHFESQLRLHMKTHPGQKNLHCTKCGFGFTIKRGWLKHFRSEEVHKCNDCDAKFPCKHLLHRHQLESHGKVLKCDKCSYQTSTEWSLQQHGMTHEPPIACETCQKHFNPKTLRRHQREQGHGIFAKAPKAGIAPRKSSKTK